MDSIGAANALLDKLLSNGLHHTFTDIEDHLNGGGAPSTAATLDFRNPHVNTFLIKN